jgi:hypothetical protein
LVRSSQQRTFGDYCGMFEKCHFRTRAPQQ